MTPTNITLEALAGAQREREAVIAWLRSQAMQCDCFAREASECACGAWDDYKQAPLPPLIDAIERGDHLIHSRSSSGEALAAIRSPASVEGEEG